MKIINDEGGQGAAEYILLFGGVIVIAIAALYIYYEYVNSTIPDLNAGGDVETVRETFLTIGH